MATIWIKGVPWFDKAYESALRRGLAERVTAIAWDYREKKAGLIYPDPAGYQRVRVQQGDVAAVLTPEGVVIGFVSRLTAQDAEPRVTTRPGQGQRKTSGGSGTTNPTSLDELDVMLRPTYRLVRQMSGHYGVVRQSDKQVLTTISATPSDHRSFLNELSRLRRLTGLPLRRVKT